MRFFCANAVFSILIVLVSINNCGTTSTLPPGHCLRENGSVDCCADYVFEKEKKICVECPKGFFGIDCYNECENGYYGRFCKEKCNCHSQYCDKETGCQDKSEANGESEGQVTSLFSFLDKKILIIVSIVAFSLVFFCIFIAVFTFFRKRWKTRLRINEVNDTRRLRHVSLSTEGTYRAANNMYVDNRSVTDNATIPEYVDIVDIESTCGAHASDSRKLYPGSKYFKSCSAGPGKEDIESKEYSGFTSIAEGGYNFLSLKRNFTNDFFNNEHSIGNAMNTRCNSFKKYRPYTPNNVTVQQNVSTSKSKTLPATNRCAAKRSKTFDESLQRNEMDTFNYDLCQPQNDGSCSDTGYQENVGNNPCISEMNQSSDNCFSTTHNRSEDTEPEYPGQMSVEQFHAENNTLSARRRNRFSRPIFNRISKLMNGLSPFNATPSNEGRQIGRNKEEIVTKSNNSSKNNEKPELPPRNHEMRLSPFNATPSNEGRRIGRNKEEMLPKSNNASKNNEKSELSPRNCLIVEQNCQGVVESDQPLNFTNTPLAELKNRKKEYLPKSEKNNIVSESSCRQRQESNKNDNGKFSYELQGPIG